MPQIRNNQGTGNSAARRPGDVLRASVQIFLVSSVNAFDSFVARRRSGAEVAGMLDDEGRVQNSTAATTIQRPIEEVYAFLQDFRNFPLFMKHLDSVVTQGNGRSRWRLRLFTGRTLEWDVVLIEDQPGELLSWRSIPGAEIDTRGVIRLAPAPGGRGTEVHAAVRFKAGKGLALLLANMLGVAPGQRLDADLRRLKALLETGEVVKSDASMYSMIRAEQPLSERFMHDVAGEAA
jgi:uncharacterized membrane protein